MAKDKKKPDLVRASTAEYLTFVAATGSNEESIEMRYEDENIWLTQRMMAELFGLDVNALSEHIESIFDDCELGPETAIRKFHTAQKEGSLDAPNDVTHYSLQMIIAVGFRVNNERAVQFRKWASGIVKDFTIQGWAMDVERLKNSGTKLTKDYFEKQLERVREIRISERRFYQKITDIYATSIDFDPSARATQRFFATVQDKMHFSVHGQTTAELLYSRADADKPHMGLTSWVGSPDSKIHKYDVTTANNYLSENEGRKLQRLVSAYLDFAELQAIRNIPMTMEDWEERLDGFLTFMNRDVLVNAGSVSAEVARDHAESVFEKYRITQDRLFENDFDRFLRLEPKDDDKKE